MAPKTRFAGDWVNDSHRLPGTVFFSCLARMGGFFMITLAASNWTDVIWCAKFRFRSIRSNGAADAVKT